MDIDALIKKAALVRPPMFVWEPRKKTTNKKKTKKARRALQHHVGKYNVVAELALAS